MVVFPPRQPIVIIGCDPCMTELLRDVLEDACFDQLHCFGWGATPPTIARFRPALLVIDSKRAHTEDDLHLLHHLRDNPLTQDVPLLLLTTAPVVGHTAPLAVPNSAVMTKPFVLGELVATVERLLGMPAERARAVGDW